MKATWTVGLLIGVVLLLANNPSRRWPQLRFGHLIYVAIGVILFAIAGAAVVGFAGSCGWLAFTSEDFREMLRRDEMRPHQFMTAYGIHLGGYVGGLIGAIWAIVKIRSFRRKYSVASCDPAKY
jgi:hypothetical protein